jgi:hypothetical protein
MALQENQGIIGAKSCRQAARTPRKFRAAEYKRLQSDAQQLSGFC